MFANCISDEVNTQNIFKNSYYSVAEKQITQFKNWQRTWIHIFPHKIYK